MTTCGRCRTANRPRRRFCSRCGAPLAAACGSCGFVNEPDEEFCGGCGQRRGPAPVEAGPGAAAPEPPPDAERRQLTVMFCDLVGSTALAGRLDPEDLREHVRTYQAACTDAIARSDGHIAQYLGDGLLVYFGYPTAHEDDPRRAVRAGLAIVTALGALNASEPPGGALLRVRIGIHTGLVVVGEVGGGLRREQLALGEAPNVAARLQSLAEPDTIVISAATRRLVGGGFACLDLGERSLDGVAQPQVVYRVLSESAPGDRSAGGAPSPATPFVGREREVALVLERWEIAADGLGQVVLVGGEAGIGKTRLVQTVAARLAGVRHTRIEGRCSPYHQHSPLHIVVQLLEDALGFDRDDTADVRRARLERSLAESGVPPAEGAPLVTSLLGLPMAGDSSVLRWTADRQRRRTIEIALELLRGWARPHPLAVVIEDLHWVDASSLEFLSLLIDQVATVPIFVLLTARPDFRPPWTARSHTTQITLTRLPRRQAEQIILGVTGHKALPPEVLQQVIRRADGVPLFIEEITKMLVESDLVREREGQYELTAPLRPLAIPVTLQDSLTARLDRLGEARPVVQLAATIGREFPYDLLEAVSPLEPAVLQRELGRLVDAEFLYRRGLPPTAHYTFKHALIQQVAYQSLLRSTRERFHRRIAAVLAERSPHVGESQPELLARHNTEAGLPAEALPWWQRAGEHAVRRSASTEAIAHFERGLALVPSLPDWLERARRELELLMALGPVLFGSRGFSAPETARVYARARELCGQLGDTPEIFPALWGQWGFFQIQGDMQRASDIADELLTRARRSGDAALLLEALHARWATSLFRGDLEVARQALEEALPLYDPERHRSLAFVYGGHDAGVCGLAFDALVQTMLGDPERAVGRGEEALQLAERLAHPHTTANALAWLALASRLCGDLEAARTRAEACQALSAEFGFPQWGGMATVIHGSALAALGEVEAGLAEMRRGLDGWRSTHAEAFQPTFLAMIAEATLDAGQVEEALGLVDDALVRVERHDERLFEAELHRLRGEALLRRTPPDGSGAEASVRRAVEVAGSQQARSWELRAAMTLARLWQREGRGLEGRQVLAQTVGRFSEAFETGDLRAAKELLGQLAGAAASAGR